MQVLKKNNTKRWVKLRVLNELKSREIYWHLLWLVPRFHRMLLFQRVEIWCIFYRMLYFFSFARKSASADKAIRIQRLHTTTAYHCGVCFPLHVDMSVRVHAGVRGSEANIEQMVISLHRMAKVCALKVDKQEEPLLSQGMFQSKNLKSTPTN